MEIDPFKKKGTFDLGPEAANLPYLSFAEKHQIVAEAFRQHRIYQEHVTKARCDKKELVYNSYGWSACLNKGELMMLGDLDQEEADDLCCRSLKKLMMIWDLDQEEADNLCNQSQEEEEEDYVCIAFQHRLARINIFRLLDGLTALKASDYTDEYFVDALFNESDDDESDDDESDDGTHRRFFLTVDENYYVERLPPPTRYHGGVYQSYEVEMECAMEVRRRRFYRYPPHLSPIINRYPFWK